MTPHKWIVSGGVGSSFAAAFLTHGVEDPFWPLILILAVGAPLSLGIFRKQLDAEIKEDRYGGLVSLSLYLFGSVTVVSAVSELTELLVESYSNEHDGKIAFGAFLFWLVTGVLKRIEAYVQAHRELMVNQGPQIHLLLNLHEQPPSFERKTKRFFAKRIVDAHKIANRLLQDGEQRFEIKEEDEEDEEGVAVEELVKHILKSIEQNRVDISVVLMPSASSRISHVGEVIRQAQSRLIKNDCSIAKYYVFQNEAQYKQGNIDFNEIIDIGPYVEANKVLLRDYQIVKEEKGTLRIIYRSELAEFDRSIQKLEIGGDTYDIGAASKTLTEVVWLKDVDQGDSFLLVTERDQTDKFRNGTVYYGAERVTTPSGRFFDSLERQVQDPSLGLWVDWSPRSAKLECALSNAAAIRDSEADLAIWTTDRVGIEDPKDWFVSWFQNDPEVLESIKPEDYIGKALVWRYSRELNDVRNLDMRRLFLLDGKNPLKYPEVDSQSIKDSACYVLAAMFLNAYFNIHTRVAYIDDFQPQEKKLENCMFRSSRDPDFEYFCGVTADNKSVCQVPPAPHYRNDFEKLWDNGETSLGLVAWLAALYGRSEEVDDVKVRIDQLFSDSIELIDIVLPEVPEHWNVADQSRSRLRRDKSYRIDNLLGFSSGLPGNSTTEQYFLEARAVVINKIGETNEPR